MKKELRGCQPQRKMDTFQLIAGEVERMKSNASVETKADKEYKVLVEMWNTHEEKIMYFFVEKMNCNMQMQSARGTYLLSGDHHLVKIVCMMLPEIQDSLKSELEIVWKHYRSLSESEQLAYADMMDADREYINNRCIYNLLGRLDDYFDGRIESDYLNMS